MKKKANNSVAAGGKSKRAKAKENRPAVNNDDSVDGGMVAESALAAATISEAQIKQEEFDDWKDWNRLLNKSPSEFKDEKLDSLNFNFKDESFDDSDSMDTMDTASNHSNST